MLWDVKNPTETSGYMDPVASTNISVGSKFISLINSYVPIVPLLLAYTFTRVISPVSGCNSFICVNAKDSEC